MPDPNTLSLDALWELLTRDGLIRRVLQVARDEDLGPPDGPGDITSVVTVEAGTRGIARLIARQAGTVAGLRAVPMLAEVFGCTQRIAADFHTADGQKIDRGQTLLTLAGPARDLLAIERTLLNIVARLSGIATRTARFVDLVAGTRAAVFDTRKTTPGFRALEKYAVRCGGGRSHRLGLFDAVLIKDNHLAGVSVDRLAGLVASASARARALAAERGRTLMFVECEVDSLDQLRALLGGSGGGKGGAGGAGLDIILLDNMTPDQLREAVARRDTSGLRIELESSGGINEQTIGEIARTGVDRISIGGLTHQAVSLDLGLDFD